MNSEKQLITLANSKQNNRDENLWSKVNACIINSNWSEFKDSFDLLVI
jgi:hypothetical protein